MDKRSISSWETTVGEWEDWLNKELGFPTEKDQPSEGRKQLVEACTDGGTELFEHLDNAFGIMSLFEQLGNNSYLSLPNGINAEDITKKSLDSEVKIWAHWKGYTLHPVRASHPLYWYGVNCRAIFDDSLKGNFQNYFMGNSSENSKQTSVITKSNSILHSLGSVPKRYGYAAVMFRCPIAGIWWRGHLSEVITNSSPQTLDEVEIHRFLIDNPVGYRVISEMAVARLTLISHPNILAAIIQELISTNAKTHKNEKKMRKFLAEVGKTFHHLSASFLEQTEVNKLVRKAHQRSMV